jgi:DNA-binding CsgD family transcriptional regulator
MRLHLADGVETCFPPSDRECRGVARRRCLSLQIPRPAPGLAPRCSVTRQGGYGLPGGVGGIPRGMQQCTRQNPSNLTGRELQVLGLLVGGRRNADIARCLFLSEKSVSHHVSAILTKLQLRSPGEAAALANQQALLVPTPQAKKTRA